MKKTILAFLLIALVCVVGGLAIELEPTANRFGYALIAVGSLYLVAGLILIWKLLSENVRIEGVRHG